MDAAQHRYVIVVQDAAGDPDLIAAAERQRNVGFDAALRRCEAAVAQARRFYDAALTATEATYRAELARIERDHGDPARVALRRPDAETRDRTEENR
jgi:hypothetical protein